MSHHILQFIIGTALTDDRFCHRLLRNPREALAGFDLADVERAAVMAIQAECLEEFAYQLHRWMTEQEGISHDRFPGYLETDLPAAPWPAACLLSLDR